MTKDPFRAALDGFEQWTAATKRKLSADPETAAGEVETLLDLMRTTSTSRARPISVPGT
jgi:hypothetical protein